MFHIRDLILSPIDESRRMRDHVLCNLRGPLHTALHDPITELPDTNQTAIFSARGTANLDNADGELEIEVIDAPAEELGPDAPAAAPAAAVVGGGERVDADGGTHARELCAEGGVRADVAGVRLRELLEQRPEHGQLRLERLRVGAAQRVAV